MSVRSVFRLMVAWLGDASRLLKRHRRAWRAARRRRWSTAKVGRSGEQLAARYLRRRGYRIVGRQVQLSAGEIDLIAVSSDRRLIFVEVKSRRGTRDTRPGTAVGRRKRRRLRRAAHEFLHRRRLGGCGIRFDVLTVVWPVDGDPPLVRHYPAAFDTEPERG